MDKKAKIAIFLSLIGNSLIFIIKLIIGVFSNSIAVMSDAIHQLTDIIDSIVMFYCVKLSYEGADETHHYGHHRAQPIAALVASIFIGIAGFEIIRIAFERFFEDNIIVFKWYFVWFLVLTLLIKVPMAFYFNRVAKEIKSPAIMADAVESRNEVILTSATISSLFLSKYSYAGYDAIIGFFIGLVVLYSSYKILKENIDYLMGHSPDLRILNMIKSKALSVDGVKGLNDLKAHYVGSAIHAEIHIEVDRDINVKKAHDIGKLVEKNVEGLGYVKEAFVHIDPV